MGTNPASCLCLCSVPPTCQHSHHQHGWYAGPTGYNAAKDTQDGYQFVYPFGWQEVSVDGTDVVYKDIIEPLESASVTISKTDKSSVTDFGNPLEVTGASYNSSDFIHGIHLTSLRQGKLSVCIHAFIVLW